MRPDWLMIPPPPATGPPTMAEHDFDPWSYPTDGRKICIYWEDGRICDRPEHEHAPPPGE